MFGLDFDPTPSWSVGFSMQQGELESRSGVVDREATSVRGGYQNDRLRWHSAIEYRDDSGTENRTQWVATNRLDYGLSDSITLLAKLNYAETDDASFSTFDSKFVEGNLGFAYRPTAESRFNLLGKYTYLYDLQSFAQDRAGTDQRSNIFSVEGIYRLNPKWDLGGKIAARRGELREDRSAGEWFESESTLLVVRASYHFLKRWDALAEYRRLAVEEDDSVRDGFLVGLDRHIGEHFKLGVGYNFTEFSDDLRLVGYEHKGWYLSVVGKY